MIINQQDLDRARRWLERQAGDDRRYDRYVRRIGNDEEFVHHFHGPEEVARFPHLLLPLGFNEYRVVVRDQIARTVSQPWYELAEEFGIEEHVSFAQESLFREESSGTWFMFEGFWGTATNPHASTGVRDLHFVGPNVDRHRHFSADEWFSVLERARRQPVATEHALWLPSAWTPDYQAAHRARLWASTRSILSLLRDKDHTLRDIGWRELEELVVELLRGKGFEVVLTPRSHDGGRDVVCRTYFGTEPVEMAVEVKQQNVVGLKDVQRALYANSSYPVILLATAGRFSAGVINEARRGENRLRLWLKDGVALSQWLDAYEARTAGTGSRDV